MLSIVLGTSGYGFLDTKNKISDQYLIFIPMDYPNNFIANLLLIYPLAVPYLFIVFAVPLYQFIIVPFFYDYIPSMLKRIWIGLVALLVELVMTSLISYFMTRDITNALIIDNMCLTFTNNITFQNELQSDILTLPFYIMAPPYLSISWLFLSFLCSFHKY